MKSAFIRVSMFSLAAIMFSCNNHQSATVKPGDSTIAAKKETKELDSLFAKESYNLEDTVKVIPVSDTLKNIRENFKRINSINNWTKKETRPTEQTTEGGEATYFYLNGKLEKIITQNYGETFQQLTEYYLLDGRLSFVFEKTLKYNRPLYYDSTAMKDNNDTETFDLKKAKTSETRNYFFNGRLFHQINQTENDLPLIDNHLSEEQERVNTSFKELMALISGK